MLSILAQRFDASEQARAQALLVFSATLARSAAAPFFAHLFDPEARGLEAARPFGLALVVVLLGSLVLSHAVLQGTRDGWAQCVTPGAAARLGRAPLSRRPPRSRAAHAAPSLHAGSAACPWTDSRGYRQ